MLWACWELTGGLFSFRSRRLGLVWRVGLALFASIAILVGYRWVGFHSCERRYLGVVSVIDGWYLGYVRGDCALVMMLYCVFFGVWGWY